MKTQEELQKLTKEMKSLNTKLEELTEDELEQVIGGSHKDGKGGKRPKFKKPCPHCNQSGAPSVLKADGWYCPVCKQKIGAYKGLAKDKAKHPRG